jgi:predicted CoA-substrate-specific enzyme activase
LIYAGCDLGIVSAKAAVLDNGDILALEVLPYRNHPAQAAVEVLDLALTKAGLSGEDIDRCLSTGFGKKAVPHADGCIPEMLCLHRAVRELNTQIRTVIDVGGHTLTAFNIDRAGRISESAITDRCAAGTGKLIEVMAKALEMPVDELSRASMDSVNPIRITSQCVILAESDVISCVNDGSDVLDIFAGVASAVAAKVAGLVRRVSVDEEVAMVGGVAKNPIVVRDLENELRLKLADLGGVDPQVVAAFGAALLAREGESGLP